MKLASIGSNPLIKEYAQGAAQSAASPVASFIAPPVQVGTSTGRFKIYDEKHRFRIPNTLRALGGAATQLGFTAADGTYNCAPNALDFPVDNLEKLETADIENIMQEGADMVAAAASLAHEKKVIDLALTAAGAGTALSIGGGDDVIDQLDKRILQVVKAARYGALMGIGIIFGAGAYRVVKNHPSVKGRFVSGGNSKFAVPSLDNIAEMLIAKPEVQMSLMCFDDAPEGLPEDIEFLMDGDILIFARMANPTRRDPSFMKTFRLRGQWMVPGSYQKEDGRGEVAKFDWSEDVQVTNSQAVDRATVAVA
ncbi:hypothetical protein OKA04_04675 [Luteolibacter flavescens]|uniref:Major capsid protein n=1 Tax=Luteolibacter flavescens TaxID=1859460 RepID=A0ABT3FKC7_9BACT|nr:hypothetical protein [Luteolibacter flavescens]MCW1884011.1 hypothetical protein [Luteolibacter flavescens]